MRSVKIHLPPKAEPKPESVEAPAFINHKAGRVSMAPGIRYQPPAYLAAVQER